MIEKYIKLFLILTCCSPIFSQEINGRICSTDPNSNACQQIARSYEVACEYNFHSVDCLLNIQSNKTHLGRITGQEAELGASFLSNEVVVLAEVMSIFPPSEMVVIAKSNIPNSFENFRGKKLCHPGYARDSSFSHFMLQEFENKIVEIEQPECNDNVTLLERHLKALSGFFSDSCRPGPWTQKDKSDQILKEQYNSLCNLCGDDKCSVYYKAPFNDSLKCLINNNADVALTTLREAKFFFNSSNNQQNYKYVCKNGTSSSYSAPCIWSSQLPDLIVAERKSANYLESYLRKNLKSYINSTKEIDGSSQGVTGEALVAILKLERWEQIRFFEQYSTYKSLKEFVEERVTLPKPADSKQCGRTLKWCTYKDKEQEKCEWLSQAAVNWAIQPVVECVRSEGHDELSCLDDVKNQKADIVVASSDYAYISFKKGLTSIAFPETDTRNLSVILAITRADDNSIKSFNDMENKRACIPRFGGKEHLTFVDTTKNLGITNDEVCDYGKVLNDFVGSSCAPGVRSSLIQESTDYVDKDKLCEQCRPVDSTLAPSYCNDNTNNTYFGNYGAIECLRDNQGDFAVITRTEVENAIDIRVICKNNTVSPYTGLNVDRDCALAVFPNSEVVAAANNVKIRDIKFALYEFERWFGQNLRKPFYLFDTFDGQPNLLFLDSTPGLNIDNEVESVQEYKRLLRKVKHCNINSGASTPTVFSVLIITIICAMFCKSYL